MLININLNLFISANSRYFSEFAAKSESRVAPAPDDIFRAIGTYPI